MKNISFDQYRKKALQKLTKLGQNPFGKLVSREDLDQAKAKSIQRKTRNRKFPTCVIFWMYVFNCFFDSFRETFLQLWTALRLGTDPSPNRDRPVDLSGYAHARYRFPLDFLHNIWDRLIQRFQNNVSDSIRTYRGFVPLAVDGTKVTLPRSSKLLETFGGPTGTPTQEEPETAQAMLLGVMNCLSGFCLDYLVRPYATHESPQLRSLLDRFLEENRPEDPLFLLDRGFFNHKNMVFLLQKGAHFLMRARDFNYRIIEEVSPGEWRVRVQVSKKARKAFPEAPRHLELRLIRYQIKGFCPKMILTNVSPKRLNKQQLVGLYHLRWRIEVFYRETKHTLSISNLRSKKPSGIRKEIAAQLLTNNMIRYLMAEATQGSGEVPILYSFQDSLRVVEKTLETILVYTFEEQLDQRNRRTVIMKLFRRMLKQIKTHRIHKRPGRWYPRRARNSPSIMPDPKYEEPVDEEIVFCESSQLNKALNRNYPVRIA